ncbi:hypothetical protein H5410_062807 [Solanum commersonii]|uniref:Uncharacterized protein n=1 Tax=Solanum commersonii TaxID=4109 RepID=A0A9J5WBN0_SOLCO|nr:hypothetical protein H5410_062807 [Solanum commersonii]
MCAHQKRSEGDTPKYALKYLLYNKLITKGEKTLMTQFKSHDRRQIQTSTQARSSKPEVTQVVNSDITTNDTIITNE